MSFARLALRRTAVEAVKAGTYAKVYDSEMAPIQQFQQGKEVPSIIVYTDDCAYELNDNELLAQGRQKLVFEIAINQKTKIPTADPETKEIVDEEFWLTPPTDQRMEMDLDLLCRDVVMGLTHPTNAWANLYRDIAFNTHKMETLRGVAGEKEDRFAARQMVFEVEMLREPSRGDVSADSVWGRFLDLVRGEEYGADIAHFLENSLAQNVDETFKAHELLMQSYGHSQGDAKSQLMIDAGGWGDDT